VDTANGAVTVEAGSTIAVEDVASLTDADDNDISIHTTAGDIEVHVMDAQTSGDVTLTADTGKIADGTVAESENIVGDSAVLTARDGIGAPGTGNLNLALTSSLSATNTGETGDIVVYQMAAGGDLSLDAVQSNLLGSGNITLVIENGTLTVVSPGVSVAGTGSVLLQAEGDGKDITIHTDLVSSGGTVTVISDGGSVTMAEGTTLQTDGRAIDVQADANVVLGRLDARAAADRTSPVDWTISLPGVRWV